MAALVDRRTPLAERLGAVNCVVQRGRRAGSATAPTEPGCVAALRRGAEFDPAGRRCLVVGAGGAARAVVAALADAGAAEVVVVNRTAARGPGGRRPGRAGGPGRGGRGRRPGDLVVNATPAGMAGATGGRAVPGSGWAGGSGPALGPGQVVVDLVYHPAVTPWLEAARARGARVPTGSACWSTRPPCRSSWWTGQEAPVDAMWRSGAGEEEAAPGSLVGRSPW